MADVQTPEAPATETPEPTVERDAGAGSSQAPSLEDIYAKYNLTPSAVQQSAPSPSYAYEQPTMPAQTAMDELNEPTVADLKRELDTLRTSLAEERGLNAEERKRIALETQQRDIADAVDYLSDHVEVPNKKLIKYVLADVWNENPTLQKIWDARREHPKMFKDALRSLVPTVQQALEVKADPDLVQKQLAMDQATKAIGSEPVAPKTEAERLSALNDANFEREWARIAGRSQ